MKRMTIKSTMDFFLQRETPYIESLFFTAQTLQINPNQLGNSFSVGAVCFFDYYTLLSYQMKQMHLTVEEMIDYIHLSQVRNLLDVYTLWQKDIKCCLRAIDACYRFQSMNLQMKNNYIEQLTEYEHNHLNSIYPTHELDQKNYSKIYRNKSFD